MYSLIPDLIVMGGLIAGLVGLIYVTGKAPKPYKRYHMVDQARRWGK